MAGTLSVVATPIGHLDDITLRALNVLRAVELIAAEDTRRTAKLLAHFGIDTPTLSFHAHNTRSRVPLLVSRLNAGDNIALVSDAGTPVVSDPGLELVQACIEAGIPVDPVPGASAPLTLAVVSGFPFNPWTIYGFPPNRPNDRAKWFRGVCDISHTVTFLESPHRVVRTLATLQGLCGERPIVIGRELTKVHQTVYRGTPASLAAADILPRGEFTIMLGPSPYLDLPKDDMASDEDVAAEFGRVTEHGRVGRRAAIRTVAARHGLPARRVYQAIERAKSDQKDPSK